MKNLVVTSKGHPRAACPQKDPPSGAALAPPVHLKPVTIGH